MTAKQRIEKIEEFVHWQRYLGGLSFHVVADPEAEDGFIIEFVKATSRQMHTLTHRLRLNEMLHIRCRARAVTEFEKPKFKKHR